MRKSGALRIGIVLLLASVAAGMFAVVGRADDPAFDQISSTAQPGFIDATGHVLYTASWHDNDNRNFTHTRVEITIPAGWTLASSDPSGCTQAGTVVTCPKGTLRFNDVVTQTVRLHSDGDVGTQVVSGALIVYEGPGNPGRSNRIPAPDTQTDVIDPATTPDKAGDCVSGNFSVGTVAGSGDSETTATAPTGTGKLCTPITIIEQSRPDPLTDIVTTEAALVPTTKPIKLKILFRNTSSHTLNFTSAVGQFVVPECDNSNAATPDPCWYDRKFRQQSATWFVNWSGIDPGWTG